MKSVYSPSDRPLVMMRSANQSTSGSPTVLFCPCAEIWNPFLSCRSSKSPSFLDLQNLPESLLLRMQRPARKMPLYQLPFCTFSSSPFSSYRVLIHLSPCNSFVCFVLSGRGSFAFQSTKWLLHGEIGRLTK